MDDGGREKMILHNSYAAELRWPWMLSFPLKNNVFSNED